MAQTVPALLNLYDLRMSVSRAPGQIAIQL